MLIREVEFAAAPEEVFAALCERRGSFLLDSALGMGGLGRFSFIGYDPFLTFRATGTEIAVERAGRIEVTHGDAMAELRRLCGCYRSVAHPGIPFAGGAVGYFSYELGLHMEQIRRTSADDLHMPDIEVGFYDGVMAFDLEARRLFLVANPVSGRAGETILRGLEDALSAGLARKEGRGEGRRRAEAPRASVTKGEYCAAVERVKDYIRSGDVYQVNLSQRYEAELCDPPYGVYRRLRRWSPAPFSSFLNFGERQLVGSSPERFIRLCDGRLETRPIKGTRPRGRTPEEDRALRQQLVASAKDRAELLMIVDLERNDLGRVCEYGSVRVDDMYRVEEHPTVFHLVATVSGQVRSHCDVFDCLRATFPGGSITGAPKIRAMQIIDELELHRRHAYTGAVGYIGFDGRCDLNIAIRTIQCVRGRAYYHVGGGVVWDSDPEAEYQETLDKGRAMRAALMGEESALSP